MVCVIYCVWALPLRIQTPTHPHLVQPLNPAKQNRLRERRFCRDSEEIYDETRYIVHEGIRDVKDFNFCAPLPPCNSPPINHPRSGEISGKASTGESSKHATAALCTPNMIYAALHLGYRAHNTHVLVADYPPCRQQSRLRRPQK